MTSSSASTPREPTTCRHEYVRIYQRRLKGLDRRLVATKAYLPVGFKMADFGHLSEGSYCFCQHCRARLFPKRTAGEKAAAKVALAAEKAQALIDQAAAAYALDAASETGEFEPFESDIDDDDDGDIAGDTTSDDNADKGVTDIHVEELEIESTELSDLEEGAVPVDDGGAADDNSES